MEKQLGKNVLFNEVLLEAIDEVLTSVGNQVKCMIYLQIKSNLGMSREQIPDRIEEFMNILQRIFGVGSRHIELQILKAIHAKTGITCPSSVQSSKFVDCVVFVKEEYEKRKL